MKPDADEIIRALKKHPDLFAEVLMALLTDPEVIVVSPWMFKASSSTHGRPAWRRIRLGYPPGATTFGAVEAVTVQEQWQMSGMLRGPGWWTWRGTLTGTPQGLEGDNTKYEYRKDAENAADAWLRRHGAIFLVEP